MLGFWRALMVRDSDFLAVAIFALAGLDMSLWAISKPVFGNLAQVLARAM
jgi:hypothetical protein